MENEESDKKGIVIFGRDISKIPCFRNSFLYGIGTGISGGLITFLVTSRPNIAMHSCMGIFSAVTCGYWIQCRYKWSQTKFMYGQMKTGMQRQAMYEGTDLEKAVLEKSEDA